MSEIGDILARATQVLDSKGWCQDELENEAGAVCAFGAINTAVMGVALAYSPGAAVRIEATGDALYDHLPESYKYADVPPGTKRWCVVQFNNSPFTTVTDVRELFAKTIADEGVSL